jgi:hypothetical protein
MAFAPYGSRKYTSLARRAAMMTVQQAMTNCKHFLRERGFAFGMGLTGALFIVVGIHRFWVRPEHFGVPSLLGCAVAAFGAFFLLLITDYVFHHAFLVFIPWFIALISFAVIQPHFGVGLGLALWFMLVSQLRS